MQRVPITDPERLIITQPGSGWYPPLPVDPDPPPTVDLTERNEHGFPIGLAALVAPPPILEQPEKPSYRPRKPKRQPNADKRPITARRLAGTSIDTEGRTVEHWETVALW